MVDFLLAEAFRDRLAQAPESHSHEPSVHANGGASDETFPTRARRFCLQLEEVESAYKPGSVRLAARQSFLSARRHRLAPATYPGTTRAALSFPYSVLLRVGFTVPRGVVPARGALLPHRFTLTCALLRPSAVCFLLHWPSARAAQALPGTLPYGARTFLDALARDATARPTPSMIIAVARTPKTKDVRKKAKNTRLFSPRLYRRKAVSLARR